MEKKQYRVRALLKSSLVFVLMTAMLTACVPQQDAAEPEAEPVADEPAVAEPEPPADELVPGPDVESNL